MTDENNSHWTFKNIAINNDIGFSKNVLRINGHFSIERK
jgi:hypothetical protein